jgi:hypothetical protein
MGNTPTSNSSESSQNMAQQSVPQACPKEIMDAYFNMQKYPLTTEWVDTRNAKVSCAGASVNLLAPIQWMYILLTFIAGIFVGVMIDTYIIQKKSDLPRT